jgi:hypothetical protein
MTVRDAIAELSKLDQDAELLVSVRVYTRAYSVARVSPETIDKCYTGAAIHISLPDNMYVVARKKAGR